MSGLYDEALLALARGPLRSLPAASTHRATVDNPLCGDSITLGVQLTGDRVAALGFELEACVICAAGAHWLHRCVLGESLAQFGQRLAELEAAVRGEAEGDAALFSGLAAHPSRHGCALLPWRAFERAIHPGSSREPEPESRPLRGRDAFAVVQDLRARGEACAMATLVSIVGSSPCPIGSRMVISASGDFWGSVSGGCVESAVVQAGLRVLAGAEPAIHGYQISNSAAGEVGLPCGGQVRVHVARAPYVKGAGELRVLELSTGTLRLTSEAELEPSLRPVAGEALGAGRGALSEGETHFVEPVPRPRRLVMVGGTHVAQKLAELAPAVGLQPVLLDSRRTLASASRFPGVERVHGVPKDVLPALLDERTAVVMLTHDARLDDPALAVALASDAFYVGALGSRKTQRARLERLREAGVAESQLSRLRGPAGLPIGGVGAGEIALSILAEIVATRRAPARVPHIGALVLAAGESTRSGERNKLLFEVDGQPMIRRVAETVLGSGVDRCVVVLGHEADRVREVLRGLEVELVMNDAFHEGMGTSIARGMRALAEPSLDAVLIALGDMPFVTDGDVRRVLDAHRPSTAHLVIAPGLARKNHHSPAKARQGDSPRLVDGVDARRGHPVLWPRRYFDALAALRGDEGGRSILRDAPGALMRVPAASDGVLRDVDRPEDLEPN